MKFKALVLSALLLALAACEKKESAPAEVNLATDEDRFSYSLGMLVGERVLKQYGDVDYQLLLAGMKAQHQGQATLLTLEEAGDSLNAHSEKQFAEQSAGNRERGEAYLKSNAEKDGVQVTESGLQFSVLTPADGPKPKATDEVTVHYRGTLIDGTEFDSSYSRGAPTSFTLNQVIPGWTEGLQLMSIGAKYQFVIPFSLGYGERGAGGQIGPFETLIFEVELIDIKS
ncbi:MAG: FKBP-type peptidyl-prolyl cis-trans isomerase [Gammaproteobacteria bacterium]|nr:FKBP-type peptidyl-prolyl cis-trans isomerase [Gammaproteobacteria bacterium]